MTAQRPKLLFLCQTLPFPPDGGVSIRTYNVMRLLSRDFDITALCFFRARDRNTRDAVARGVNGLRSFAKVEAFEIPQEHSRWRLLFDHARSVVSRQAYTVYAYRSHAYRSRVRELMATEDFAIVHMDSLDLSDYLQDVAGVPVVCVHHNVESALLRRRSATSRWPMSVYLGHQATLTERLERSCCPEVALNVTVSPDDATELRRLAPAGRYTVVPNGVDTQTFHPARTDERSESGVVFVGGYGWQPNRDAMNFFCERVLPRMRARGVSAPITWVGRASVEVRAMYRARWGVHLTGYVDDIRPLVLAAACYVAPLRAGGGTRLKILDALAMGKAVVSTTVGCEGLDVVDGKNILIRDEPEAFAEAVLSILRDPIRRHALGSCARATAEQVYDWEVIGRPMLAEYHSILSTGETPSMRAAREPAAHPTATRVSLS